MSGKLMPEDVLRNVFEAIANVDNITIEYVDDVLRIKDDGVSTVKILDDAVDKDKINADVAGDGLGQNVDGSLEVNVDDSTIEIDTDILRVKDDGIVKEKINPDVAGLGIVQAGNGSLEVNTDESTIEINSDIVRIKDDGVTKEKINSDVAGNGLGQNVDGSLEANIDDISVGINTDNLYSKQNIYVAYADDVTGVGFTETFSTARDYIAILYTATPIETLSVSNFTGLWFRIAKFGDTFGYENLKFYDTHEKGLFNSNMLVGTMSPIAYYFEGTYRRVYFGYFEGRKDSAGNVRGGGRESRSWITYYDVDTKMFAEEQTFTETYPDSDDLHNLPVLIVADSGHILFFKEELNPAAGTHNSPMEIWRSDNVEDISAFTKIALLSYELAYPQVFKIADGTLFLYCRERISGNEYYNAIFKSEDDGATWRSLTDVLNTKTQILSYNVAGYFAYPRSVIGTLAQGINIILNPDIGVGGNYESIMFMHSDDGNIWQNAREYVEGTGYSHDVAISGILDASDLDTNYLVDGPIADPVNTALFSSNGAIDPDGIPYTMAAYYTDTGGTGQRNVYLNIYLYYYDIATHAWIKKDILPSIVRSGDEFGEVISSYFKIIAYGNGLIDVICTMTKTIGNLITPDTIISSGTLTAGNYYRIITTDNSIKPGVAIGGIFMSVGTETADGTNTVVAIRTSMYVFKSEDYGDNFSYYDLDSKYNKTGGFGAIGINFNCLEKKQMFLVTQNFETSSLTGTPLVEYANMIMFHSKID